MDKAASRIRLRKTNTFGMRLGYKKNAKVVHLQRNVLLLHS